MIKQKYRICKKCHISGGLFAVRKAKLASGKIVYYVYSSCVICEREDARERNRKNYRNPHKRIIKRRKNRLSKIKFHDKILKANKLYYSKNRERIREEHREYYRNNKKNILAKTNLYKLRNRKIRVLNNKEHIWRALEAQRINEVIDRKNKKILNLF